MRVLLYKRDGSVRTLMVVPELHTHRAPIVNQVSTKEALREVVKLAVEQAVRPREQAGWHQPGLPE